MIKASFSLIITLCICWTNVITFECWTNKEKQIYYPRLLYPANGRVYSDRLRPSVCVAVCLSVRPSVNFFYATQYLKSRYSCQLRINITCVSYWSPHLERLWARSVDFPFFCELESFPWNP